MLEMEKEWLKNGNILMEEGEINGFKYRKYAPADPEVRRKNFEKFVEAMWKLVNGKLKY